MVDTFGTNTVPEAAIMRAVSEVFDLTPRGIMADLELRKPIYEKTAAYGHFGRQPEKDGSGKKAKTFFTWERTDRVKQLLKAVKP
jgi:S-adenosylmethionine synthetase